ncbi:MAG TPA: FAD-dependent oxidoreductase, partial [Candidatus Avalokitesvara rifleensis]|uniref:FAD-dependent oxidoreductase n=1 Tax=Candidatus Avalokitesvara rifleensis TaxID=3367620 RepID=UPI0040282CE6
AIPRTAYVVLASTIKENVDVPVIAGIRINDLASAEELLGDGQADLVSIGRPLIADPELPKKYREGRLEDIRTCIACNQGCFDELLNMRPVSCLYNPRAGREREYTIKPAVQKKKVLVIGGGPGGMEAASVAAQRGHDVTLYEKAKILGGQLYYAYKPPGREEFENVITYLERQIEKEGVKVVLGVEANPETIKKERPNVLILSTGSIPSIPPIPGINGKNVALARDILDGKVPVGREVVIIGGGTVGCETAIYVAKLGSMKPEVALFLLRNEIIDLPTALERTARGHRSVTILDIKRRVGGGFGISTRWVMEREMEDAGIKSVTGVKVKEIKEEPESGVLYEKEGQETFIPAEIVIIATGYVPNDSLSKHLNGLVPEVYTIGDCVKVRTAMEAIHEGFKVGLTI